MILKLVQIQNLLKLIQKVKKEKLIWFFLYILRRTRCNIEEEMIYFTYKWMTDNITYDFEYLIGNKNNIVYNPNEVLE